VRGITQENPPGAPWLKGTIRQVVEWKGASTERKQSLVHASGAISSGSYSAQLDCLKRWAALPKFNLWRNIFGLRPVDHGRTLNGFGGISPKT
jgi:hypothetical protein